MQPDDIFKFIKQYQGNVSLTTLKRYFPNTSPMNISTAIKWWLEGVEK